MIYKQKCILIKFGISSIQYNISNTIFIGNMYIDSRKCIRERLYKCLNLFNYFTQFYKFPCTYERGCTGVKVVYTDALETNGEFHSSKDGDKGFKRGARGRRIRQELFSTRALLVIERGCGSRRLFDLLKFHVETGARF